MVRPAPDLPERNLRDRIARFLVGVISTPARLRIFAIELRAVQLEAIDEYGNVGIFAIELRGRGEKQLRRQVRELENLRDRIASRF